eukprot:12194-Heterococcus_DN1.PRE.2
MHNTFTCPLKITLMCYHACYAFARQNYPCYSAVMIYFYFSEHHYAPARLHKSTLRALLRMPYATLDTAAIVVLVVLRSNSN